MGEKPGAPALRYHGAKWLLADWIIGHFPPHDCYVEPFGGSAAVLLQKQRSCLEVYNDLAGDLVTFFRVLRDQPEALIRRIELTPYAIEEWRAALIDEPVSDIERARQFYIRSYMSLAGPTAQWKTGWRRQKMITRQNGQRRMTPAAIVFMRIEHLYEVADRLRGVQIDQAVAGEIIERYDSAETLIYLDPPYPAEVRGRWAKTAYQFEMEDGDHEALARQLHDVAGMALISGYRCDLYDRLYADWKRVDKSVRVNGPGHAVESLWISPGAVKRWQTMLPLFNATTGGS